MGRTILLVFLSFFPCRCYTQSVELDSLLRRLEFTAQDTNRVLLLLDVHEQYLHSDVAQSLPHTQEALELSKTLGYTKGEALSENALGMYHLYHDENREKALEHVLRSVQILDSIGDEDHLNISYNNLGLVYQRLERHKDSQAIYLKLYERLKEGPINQTLLGTCNNLGLAYQHDGNFEKALEWYNVLNELSEEINMQFGVMMANGNISRVYGEMKNFEKMMEHAKVVLNISEQLGMAKHLANSHQLIGKAYGELGQMTKAIHHLEVSDSMSIELKDLRMITGGRKLLSGFYAESGDHRTAFEYLESAQAYNDSILQKENQERIEEMRVKFKTEEAIKDKELAELQAQSERLEKERNRNLAYGLGAIAVLIILLAALQINRMRSKRKAEQLETELKLKEEEAKWNEQLRQSRMSALKSQMNPHFIFNAMNSVQSLFYADEKEKASKYLGRFSKLMRNVLEMSDQPTVSLYKEIEALTSYLELEQLRFEGNFKFDIDLDEEIDDEMVKIPSMLIQPYVENAIKHGLLHKDGDCRLSIIIKQPDANSLTVIVADNGVGREASEAIRKDKNPEHRSFASDATATRLELLNNNRTDKLSVEFEDLKGDDGKPAGTKVSISIPLNG